MVTPYPNVLTPRDCDGWKWTQGANGLMVANDFGVVILGIIEVWRAG